MVYSRVPDGHVQTALDVMTDMVFAPSFAELDSEREVVLEEIAMYEDTPQELVHDLFSEAVFGSHPLGRPVIGTAEVISSVTPRVARPITGSMYAGGNIVVAAAGNLEHNKFVQMMSERSASSGRRRGGPRVRRPLVKAPPPGFRFQRRTPSSTTSASARPESRAPTAVASPPRSSTRSSAALRRRASSRRSARSVGWRTPSTRFASQYTDTGLVGIYVGTREENLVECLDIAAEQSATSPRGNLRRASSSAPRRT